MALALAARRGPRWLRRAGLAITVVSGVLFLLLVVALRFVYTQAVSGPVASAVSPDGKIQVDCVLVPPSEPSPEMFVALAAVVTYRDRPLFRKRIVPLESLAFSAGWDTSRLKIVWPTPDSVAIVMPPAIGEPVVGREHDVGPDYTPRGFLPTLAALNSEILTGFYATGRPWAPATRQEPPLPPWAAPTRKGPSLPQGAAP